MIKITICNGCAALLSTGNDHLRSTLLVADVALRIGRQQAAVLCNKECARMGVGILTYLILQKKLTVTEQAYNA